MPMTIPSRQRPPGRYLQLNKLGLLLVAMRGNIQHEEPRGILERGHWEELTGLGLVLVVPERIKEARLFPVLNAIRKQEQFYDGVY